MRSRYSAYVLGESQYLRETWAPQTCPADLDVDPSAADAPRWLGLQIKRFTPLDATHLRLMHELTLAGAVILPPVPGFYQKPKTLMDLVDHSVGKALDQLGIEHQLFRRWTGPERSS